MFFFGELPEKCRGFDLLAIAAGLLVIQGGAVGSQPAADPPAATSPADGEKPGRSASGKLPLEKAPRERQVPLLRPIAGPREFLSKYGIGQSQWNGFFSGQPLSAAEEETLIRLLSLYSRFGQENVEAWAVRGITWDQLAASADEHRGELFRLTGRVQRISQVELLPELASRYDFPRYHQVRMRIDDAPYVAVIYCLALPAAWKPDAQLDEPASAYGLFLKVGEARGESPELLFATGRVAWHPDRPQPALNVDSAHVALAKLGVDIGRFQEVGREKGAGLLAADREPFYQILSALGDRRADELWKPQRQETDVAFLLQQPEKFQGHVLPVRGVARRVARIDVSDRDIRQRFGIDHYYEVDLTVPLERTIRLGANPKEKTEAIVYENSFPATICVRQLPPGLPVGDDVRQTVEADAVFFKIWLYQSAFTSRAKLAQPAPLFLARQVHIVAEQPPARWVSDLLVGGAMVVALVMFVGIVLWFRWTDRARSKRNPLDEQRKPEPDFSNLR